MNLDSGRTSRQFLGAAVITVISFLLIAAGTVAAQGSDTGQPIVVRPGAPGKPTIVLPSNTRPMPPSTSRKDVEFMQGMIMHHAQAVEMTALIESRTTNPDVRLLGSRISQSQVDEMQFMERWLTVRKETTMVAASDSRKSHGHNDAGSSKLMRMPGMLSPEQMKALQAAKGAEFDRLFLSGMIQHHQGALEMVKDLFDTAGAGQDAELFSFASDVDSGQRAEIKTMETLLGKLP